MDIKLDFKDVLIRPKRSTLRSRADVDLSRSFPFRNSKREWTGIPICAANMDTTGTFDTAALLSKHAMLTCMAKSTSVDDWRCFSSTSPSAMHRVAISAGTSSADYAVVTAACDAVPSLEFICLDVANGYSEYFVDSVRKYREAFPRHTIIAGNVVTGEMCEELILTGADIVKVGIGPGSVCTTRKQTGVGYPQLSAVLECADAAHGLNGHIIADGGCACPGDIAKAFGGGADFVMLGGMLAGHDESGGELIVRDGKQFKLFYGMSSGTAMLKYAGGVAECASMLQAGTPWRKRVRAYVPLRARGVGGTVLRAFFKNNATR